MMKILFVNKFFFLNGGSERVFFQERDFLFNHGVQVVDFSMIDPRNFPSPYADFFVPKIDFHSQVSLWKKITQGVRFIHSPEAVRSIEEIVRQERPIIAHLHNIYHQLTPSIIPVLKKYGVKVVLTLHDGKLICPNYLMLKRGEICTGCEGRKFWKPALLRCQGSLLQGLLFSLEAYWHKIKRSYQGVDLFISPSQFLADLVNCRISAERIRVLHNGIDHEKYQPRYQDDGYGLYLGRLSKEKGVATLLKAHQKMAGDFSLKIAGSGPLEQDLRREYGDAEFLGYKSGDELNEIISRSSFVVVPSEWYENCSMVVLEAMAMGKPVIGSRIGGIPEQIEEGKTGFLFEAGNASELAAKMKMLAENHSMRLDFGKQARQKLVSSYSLEKHCEGLLDIYGELLNDD